MRIIKRILLFIALIISINKVNAQKKSGRYIIFEGTADAKYNGEYVHIYNNILKENFKIYNYVNPSSSVSQNSSTLYNKIS